MNAAAEALDADTDLVARRAVELTYESVPAYAAALDARGRRHCEDDARYHVRALVGALAISEISVFVDYARWCADLLARHGIAAENLVAMFRATGTAIEELVPAASNTASIHLRAAEDDLAGR